MSLQTEIETLPFFDNPIVAKNGTYDGEELREIVISGPRAAMSKPLVDTILRNRVSVSAKRDMWNGLGLRVSRLPEEMGSTLRLQTEDIQYPSDRLALELQLASIVVPQTITDIQWFRPDRMSIVGVQKNESEGYLLHIGTF